MNRTAGDRERDARAAETCVWAGLLAAVELRPLLAETLTAGWSRADEDGTPWLPLGNAWYNVAAIETIADIAASLLLGASVEDRTGVLVGAEMAIRTARSAFEAAESREVLKEALDKLMRALTAYLSSSRHGDLSWTSSAVAQSSLHGNVAYELRGGIHRGVFPERRTGRLMPTPTAPAARIVTGSAREIAYALVAPHTATDWNEADLVRATYGDEDSARTAMRHLTEAAHGAAITWKVASDLARDLNHRARKTARKAFAA